MYSKNCWKALKLRDIHCSHFFPYKCFFKTRMYIHDSVESEKKEYSQLRLNQHLDHACKWKYGVETIIVTTNHWPRNGTFDMICVNEQLNLSRIFAKSNTTIWTSLRTSHLRLSRHRYVQIKINHILCKNLETIFKAPSSPSISITARIKEFSFYVHPLTNIFTHTLFSEHFHPKWFKYPLHFFGF